MPRLGKVIQDLNIGLGTATEFLKSNFGLKTISYNTNITDEQYKIISEHFNYDKVWHSTVKKKYKSRKTRKNLNPKQAEYTEEEKDMLKDVGDFYLSKYIIVGKKRRKRVRARKGVDTSSNKSRGILFPKGYIRIVNVPFGGMNKRR